MKTIQSPVQPPLSSFWSHQPPEQIAFLDIETTGLSPRTSSIYLIGAMCYDPSSHLWNITQWFADDYRSEADILTSLLGFLRPFRAVFHFNGDTFDIPYILTRCSKHHIPIPEYAMELFCHHASYQAPTDGERIGIDLLREIRPLQKKLHLPHADQTSLERWLGVQREDTYKGGELIRVYTEYMQSKFLRPQDAGRLERLLLLHNHDDIVGMLAAFSILSYRKALAPDEPPILSDCTLMQDQAEISFPLKTPVPKAVKLEHPFTDGGAGLTPALLSLEGSDATLTLPLRKDTLRFFFTPYRDYYYLPQEDTAIHKSVACFVDPAFRQKATAATCYAKKEGIFLPSLSPKPSSWEDPLFYTGYREKPAYHLLPDCQEQLFQKISGYLYYELPSF